ncbi:MAG TPA: hypothetical protein VHU61_15510 [Solirubrobacteraceae bacterium]|nr:hypothetical protein [Solirubrobacteraceae bacterium]
MIVAAAFAGWFTFGAAPSYQSSASLWVDNGASVSSSLDSGANTGSGTVGPASLESEVLDELLATSSFSESVAKGSQLVSFFAAGKTSGGFSLSALMARRHEREAPLGQAMLSISTGVTTMVAGPQVLNISYDGPSPTVAQSVVRSLLKQLRKAGNKYSATIGQAADSYYHKRLQSAMSLAENNQDALSAYEHTHPGAGQGDADYTALAAEARTSAARLATLKLNSNQASVEESSGNGASAATTSVLDAASLSDTPTSGMFMHVLGVFAGGFVGLVLSVAALMLLHAPPETRRWDAEMPRLERLAWSEEPLPRPINEQPRGHGRPGRISDDPAPPSLRRG